LTDCRCFDESFTGPRCDEAFDISFVRGRDGGREGDGKKCGL